MPRDDSCGSSTLLSTDVSDSYVDAEEEPSQSFSHCINDHHHPDQLPTSPTVDDTSYRAQDDHSAYVDHEAEDPRSRVTHQRDEVAHQRRLAPDANIIVTAVHDRRQHTEKAATSIVNRESVAAIHSLEDEQLAAQFQFIKRVGHGNWGEVWVCRPVQGSGGTIGHASASWSGMDSGGRVAIKLVQRKDNPVSDDERARTKHRMLTLTWQTATHCIRALWGEMKIIRHLRHEPHPSIIQFEAFVLCPSFAAVVMPFHREQMQTPLPLLRALRYFRQLASAVAYLHERGITHNDIKPANIVISFSDVPVLVDFGFAQHHRIDDTKRFLSTSSWGTPEYLDPLRVMGQPHDERMSDVWSLGVTMYEAVVGRTPFEMYPEETFETQDDLNEYLRRSRSGKWYGDFNIGDRKCPGKVSREEGADTLGDLESLLQHMLYPDPIYRLSAPEVHNTISNILNMYDQSSLVTTPSFVDKVVTRDDSFDIDAYEAMMTRERERGLMERRALDEAERHRYEIAQERARCEVTPQRKLKTVQSEVIRRKDPERRASGALAESRKQTSSAAMLRPAKQLARRAPTQNGLGQENVFNTGDVRKEVVIVNESPKAEGESAHLELAS